MTGAARGYDPYERFKLKREKELHETGRLPELCP